MLKTGADRERVLPLLEELGGVTADNVRKVSEITKVPEAEIWGAGTFYTLLKPGKRMRVCNGLTCRLFGADDIIEKLRKDGKEVEAVSCLGQCDRAPAALDEDMNVVSHGTQERAVTPASDDLAVNLAGEHGLQLCARLRRPANSSRTISTSCSRPPACKGRGGAGFPAHIKWKGVYSQPDPVRYVACNGDEAEPATFKDRETMLRRPDKLIEGMAIAAHAVGARRSATSTSEASSTRSISSVKAALEKAGDHVSALWTGTSTTATAPTSAAKKPRCSKAWKASAACPGSSRRSRTSTASAASPR
jgi:hypothetical protein